MGTTIANSCRKEEEERPRPYPETLVALAYFTRAMVVVQLVEMGTREQLLGQKIGLTEWFPFDSPYCVPQHALSTKAPQNGTNQRSSLD